MKPELEAKLQKAYDLFATDDNWIPPFGAFVLPEIMKQKNLDKLDDRGILNLVEKIIKDQSVKAVNEMKGLSQRIEIETDQSELLVHPRFHSLGDAVYRRKYIIYELDHIKTRSGKKILAGK